MFPIGDDNRGRHGVCWVSWLLILANVLVYVYQINLNDAQLHRFIRDFGMTPAMVARGDDVYTLFSSMFVHGGFAHIAGNMLFLWIFGDNIEQRFGHVPFLLFYLGSGLVASVAHLWANSGATVPMVGASGAISGVMGAYVLFYPLNRVRVLMWYGVVRVPAFIFLGIWFLTQFANGMMTLSVQTAQSSGVAFWAHIGGFVAGLAAALVLGVIFPEPIANEPQFAIWQNRDE